MVDIQSAAAENRRGKKKKEEKQKPQLQNIMSASATQGDRGTGKVSVGLYSALS